MRARRIVLYVLAAYLGISAALGVILAEVAFNPQRKPLTHTDLFRAVAARFGAELKDVEMTAPDGTMLKAWFARPSESNGNAVIMLHGVGDNREGVAGFAGLFLSHGYSILLPDSRAHGESGGRFPTYGIKESADVRAWYDWLAAHDRPKCVYSLGESMGAAILLQSLRTTPFCAVVAESPFASFRQVAYVRIGQSFHAGAWLGRTILRPGIESAFLIGWLTRGVNLAAASPEDSVAATRVPVLLIHGLADQNIPPQQSEAIRARNPSDVILWEVPNAGHCGASAASPDEFSSRVIAWFATHRQQ